MYIKYDNTCETIEKHEKEDSIMTNHFQPGVNTKIKRVFKATASVLLIAVMAFAMLFSSSNDSFAAEGSADELWAITIGDEDVLFVDSEESATQVIEGLKNYYLTQGSTVLDVQFEPQIQIKKVIKTTGDDYAAQSANTTNVEDAVTQLSEGKVEYFVYKT